MPSTFCPICQVRDVLHLIAGDADAEVKKLLGESAQLTSSQQEAEAELLQSQQTIQELQAALKNAQVQPTCVCCCKRTVLVRQAV